jgi:hypothetical protein
MVIERCDLCKRVGMTCEKPLTFNSETKSRIIHKPEGRQGVSLIPIEQCVTRLGIKVRVQELTGLRW